eukprot:SAG11_NODE_2530_length_3250_cov_2.524913_4_plen_90_part_00
MRMRHGNQEEESAEARARPPLAMGAPFRPRWPSPFGGANRADISEEASGGAIRAELEPLRLADEVEVVRLEAGLVNRVPRRLARGLERA